ncbi:MAG: DUF1003 domain-containing protein [Flavobacteriaceae bacterium]|nr:DUF1003 domain-containing protein [Flavobacteriaceae bacterium]
MITDVCHITKKKYPLEELTAFESIKKQVLSLILKEFPDFSKGQFISTTELNRFRKRYLESLIKTENRELNRLEKEVIKAISENKILSENIEPEIESELTFGQRLADKIAEFGGSWSFIIVFFSLLILWMALNVWVLATKPFDPYPFILLNLILSCLAAIQAPIIMMSQNRQEQKDRVRSEHDYKVNLKAELEIRLLHEKIDHLIVHQNKRLLEIQELQLDYLNQLTEKKDKSN